MPEQLAPGVFIDEVAVGPGPVQGVSTSTAGFVGPTPFGPTTAAPVALTSFADFQRIYGGLDQLGHDRSAASSADRVPPQRDAVVAASPG